MSSKDTVLLAKPPEPPSILIPPFGRGEGGTLFFRVLDRARVVEAIDLVIQCVGTLFQEIKGDLSFWNDDVLLLQRHGRQLRFYEPSKAEDRPFWTPARRLLMQGPAG